MARDEVVNFAKNIFNNASLELIQKAGAGFEHRSDSDSPQRRGGDWRAERSATIKVPDYSTMTKEMKKEQYMVMAVSQSERIWNNLCSYVELVPITLRYLCKMIITILRKKCGTKLTPEKEQSIISDIIIKKLILTALDQPIEYNVVIDCVVKEDYTEIAKNSKKVLTALGGGIIFDKNVPIAKIANDFIKSEQNNVRKFVKDLLEFSLPIYEQDYVPRAEEIVTAQGICFTLLSIQLIFDLLVHNYRYYSKRYPRVVSLMNRLIYHVTEENMLVPKRELFKSLDSAVEKLEFEQAYKYFIFTEVKIKQLEVEAPLILQKHSESVLGRVRVETSD